MTYRTVEDVIDEAQAKGWRKAFVVTALQLELEAVLAHVDRIGYVAGQDGSLFECGTFEDQGHIWLIVAAQTGAGNHPSQSVVTFGHRTFEDFELQLFVGVGGSRKSEAPIGSVVASRFVYFAYGGKYGEHGFRSRPRVFQVDTLLSSIAQKVALEQTWINRITDPLHHSLPATDSTGLAHPPAGLVQAICSIEAVLDDPASELEAIIAEHYGDTYVVDMEGYGALYAATQERTPAIVVRGVSDMTQGKTAEADAVAQPIAAAHAAAFAFEMLSHWGQIKSHARGAGSPVIRDKAVPREPEADGATADPPGTAAPAPHANLVLHLDGLIDDVTPEWREKMQALLRDIGGSAGILILRAEAGSIRLFVADPDDSLAQVGLPGLREAIEASFGVELLGIASPQDIALADAAVDQFAAASGELLAWPQALPNGERIERPEYATLAERIDNDTRSATVLLGLPGAGKSALLASIANQYAARRWPVLAIKADALNPTIQSEASLSEHLGFGISISELVERTARFRPVLIVIDQLDALAGYLDLQTARLSVLLNLVRRIGRLDNVHIVLSARTFEFEHDTRLRAIQADQLVLQLPGLSTVVELLEQQGIKAAGWPIDAQEVLRTPQALSIYLKLSARKTSEPIRDYQAMLEQLWLERVLVGTDGPRRSKLLTTLAVHMAEEESLWLAAARFEDSRSDIIALESAGILASNDAGIGFAHQTIFDFALARSFAGKPGLLPEYVLERQDSLFLRPKLWVGLGYLRRADVNAYHKELEKIWNEPDLRRHLRQLLIDFLGQERTPTDREALVMEQVLIDPKLRWRGFRALAGSPGWFERFAGSYIRDAMVADEEAGDRMIEVLSRALPFAADQVNGLIEAVWLSDKANDNRVWNVLQSARSWTARSVAQAQTVIRRSEVAPSRVDWIVSAIGADQPDAALALIRTSLEQSLIGAVAEAEERTKVPRPSGTDQGAYTAWHLRHYPPDPIKKLIENSRDWDSLSALAEEHPKAFLDTLWPWFLDALARLDHFVGRREGLPGYPLTRELDFRFENERGFGLPEPAVPGAIANALELIAERDPEDFLSWISQQASSDFGPVHRLIAHVLATQAERYASSALDYLLSDDRRFTLGGISNMRGTTLRLVAAASPHWSTEQIERYEQAVADYSYPPIPDRNDAQTRRLQRQFVRQAKLELLRALPKNQRSAKARRQIQEEERVFGKARDDDETKIEATLVDSPLSAVAMQKAGNDAIVRAFEVLPDATGWDHPRHFMIGGNIQLSREFATFAAQQPARARAILDRLTPVNGTRAAGYALDAMGENVAGDLVCDLFIDVVEHGFDGEEFRGSAARGIEKLIRRNHGLPEQVLAILEHWLTVQPPKAPGEETDTDAIDTAAKGENAETNPLQRSLIWGHGGLSILPHGDYPVLETLLHARLARGETEILFGTLGAYLDRGRDIKIWEQLLLDIDRIRPDDPNLKSTFLTRLFDLMPGLVGTKSAALIMANLTRENPGLVDRHLDAWRDGTGDRARMAYGEIVGIAALIAPELAWASQRLDAVMGDLSQRDARIGLAHSAVHLWGDPDLRDRANAILIRLVEDGPKEVWHAVADLFRLVDQLSPDAATTELLATMADRLDDAPRLDPTFIVERLASLLPHQARLIGRLALRLVQHWRDDLGDVRTSAALAATDLVNLAVTLHRLGPDTRELGTSLFEMLLDIESYAALETLDQIDNRFRERAPVPRRRLARRTRRRSRVTRPARHAPDLS